MDSPCYNLRRADRTFRSLAKPHLLELARDGLLLPTDQLTDLRDGRTVSASEEFPGWFSDAGTRRIESVEVLEERVARLPNRGASPTPSAVPDAPASRPAGESELLQELRAIRAECAKTKWAVRAIGLIIIGVLLGLYGVP